jgi:outer membrane protein, heavy metal efflux system
MFRLVIPLLCLAALFAAFAGCHSDRQRRVEPNLPLSQRSAEEPPAATVRAPSSLVVQLAAHQAVTEEPNAGASQPLPAPLQARIEVIESSPVSEHAETLESLEVLALANNPTLRRMQHEAAAEWAQTGYVSKLPDPTISSMFYLPPMNYEPDRLVAELQVMQMIPWVGRLKAEAQQAHMEALAAENAFLAERLKVVAEVRMNWYRLYVLGKQIETTKADQAQLESLIRTANARVAAGDAQPGDVLMGTLELSSLQEQLLTYRQELTSTAAELNRLVGRDARIPIVPPRTIQAESPSWDHDLLRSIAMNAQPELNAARLQTAATRSGIEVARLKQRPDVSISGGWMAMDAPGAMMPGAGADSWTLGFSTNLPIYHRKYEAMQNEASREHFAAHASEDEIALRLDASLRDLWAQAEAAQRTIELYEKTILPQARQTFEADQKSLVNNTVTFDRVIRDYRTLLSLELGYHKSLGQFATTLARIRQTVGVDLLATPEPSPTNPR